MNSPKNPTPRNRSDIVEDLPIMVVEEGTDGRLRHFGRELGLHGRGIGSLFKHFLQILMGSQGLTKQPIKARKQ